MNFLRIIISIILLAYYRKTLKVQEPGSKWIQFLRLGFIIPIVFIFLLSVFPKSLWIVNWLSDLFLIGLLYVFFTQKDFLKVKNIGYGFAPVLAVWVLVDIIHLINAHLYFSWKDFFESAKFFAFLWMISYWVITRRQIKALEMERKKTEEKEQEIIITENLKAKLELQVAERTAEITKQKESLEEALRSLKSTQAQLIQSEKMASLGELTAGIAHEIQNPLNFMNNFSDLNKELVEEIKEELQLGNTHQVLQLAENLAENEEKINFHGKRADAIVKGMLQHSRVSTGHKEPTPINALADEYLRLAYHGLRAKDKSFNASLITHFDPNLGNIDLIPQDMGRAILNLITNAFYAVTEKKKESPEGYEPTITVTTRKLANRVEISIKDNGKGIPSEIVDKIFQPFFTTKPTGLGTGLGLSLTYDIVMAQEGKLKLESVEGQGAEFIIQLPL